ncbi:MAG: S-layer homology domain-containing protein [Defluviitaleaceae bacterium]|nr:S-layer homology domain-containing protein [Defluviitaleaceae bacterium]
MRKLTARMFAMVLALFIALGNMPAGVTAQAGEPAGYGYGSEQGYYVEPDDDYDPEYGHHTDPVEPSEPTEPTVPDSEEEPDYEDEEYPDLDDEDYKVEEEDEDEEEEIEEIEEHVLPVSTGTITVYIGLESYNLEHGFYIEPVAFNISAGLGADYPTRAMLNDRSRGASDVIMNEIERTIDGFLESRVHNLSAGWAFAANHNLFDIPADSYMLAHGDVIQWKFSLTDTNQPLHTYADRSELVRALVVGRGTEEARQAALDVVSNPLSTAKEAEQALEALLAEADVLKLPDPLSLPNPHDALTDALSWIRADTPSPGISSEWMVLAMARAGIDDVAWYNRYLASLNAALPGGGAGLTSSTDFARVTLALTALGLDASNYNGHDLTEAFSVFTPGGPINSNIFALIALDSRPYHGIRGQLTGVRQQYVNAIVAAQESGGYWDNWGPDVDATAQAIQALAPYSSHANVNVSINNALNWLSSEQTSNGGWQSWGSYSAESSAQVIIALTTLGIDPQSDYRFVKDSGNPITALLSLQDSASGGFTADWGDFGGIVVNAMSTEQAAHALVAYDRFRSGRDALYDMRDAGEMTVTLPGGGGDQPGGGTGPSIPSVPVGSAFISVRDPAQAPFFEGDIDIELGETVYSLLRKTGLAVVSAGGYVSSINGLAEFDAGPLSGWVFSINGVFPPTSAMNVRLNSGDRVEWLFTRDLGADVGAPQQDDDTEDSVPPPAGGIAVVVPEEAEDGTAVAEVGHELVLALIEQAIEEGLREIVIFVAAEGASRVKVALRAESIRDVAQHDMSLTIQSDVAIITLDSLTLAGLVYGVEDDSEVEIISEIVDVDTVLSDEQREVVGGNPVTSLMITVDESTVRNFDGVAAVILPYMPPADLQEEDFDLLTVYHLSVNAGIQEMVGASYNNGEITFTTNHFSLFFAGVWISPFEDVASDDWFARAARFVHAEGFMRGMSQGRFEPDANFSRAETISMFWMLEGEPEISSGGVFDDVSSGQWYYRAVAWANTAGIAGGRGDGTFGPNDYATLEQFVRFLYNYSRYKGLEDSLADVDEANTWASDAIEWASSNGLLDGVTSVSAHEDAVSRAEAAEILRRFVGHIS